MSLTAKNQTSSPRQTSLRHAGGGRVRPNALLPGRMRPPFFFAVLAVAALAVAAVLPAAGLAAAQPQPAGAPAAADDSPVQVETLDLEPTVVKTGDPISQTYRVRFPDLIDQGREIIILEDRMVPETLPVHPFEGISLDIRKRQVEDEHVWDFTYVFRLIAPEKSTYVLPGFSFYYLVRDLGEDVEDAEVRQIDGGSNLVRYVTTLTDTPLLDIRDTIDLGSFSARATAFRALAWTVAPLPLLVWLVLLVRQARRPKAVSEAKRQEDEELQRIEAQIQPPPSIWQARRALRQHVRSLDALAPSENGAALSDLRQNLIISGRDYLRAELPGLHTGDTPRDISAHVAELGDGSRKEALGRLAERLVDYQRSLESGSAAPIEDPAGEARVFDESLAMLRPHVRLWARIKGLVGLR